MRKHHLILALMPLFLIGCGPDEPVVPDEPEVPVVDEETVPESDRETKNVVYRGVVQPAGISIYMEGSHKLVLSDDRFILLTSEDVDLNGYIGEEVEAFGSVRATVEAGGMIMTVERMQLVQPRDDEDTMSGSAASSAVSSASAKSESMPSSKASRSSASSVEGDEPVSTTPSVEMQAKIDLMARQDFSAANWTQKYCTGHIGFCIPVHRNWWFTSFGTTGTHLWHVELSSEAIVDLGDGPIIVAVVSGTVESKGATDGQVSQVGSAVIGYRAWTDNRHFEISAPESLRSAVSYLTEHVEPYEE